SCPKTGHHFSGSCVVREANQKGFVVVVVGKPRARSASRERFLLPFPTELGCSRVRQYQVAEVGNIRLRAGEGRARRARGGVKVTKQMVCKSGFTPSCRTLCHSRRFASAFFT